MKGRAWRRGANAMARALWKDGKCFLAYQLLREVIEDTRTEQLGGE